MRVSSVTTPSPRAEKFSPSRYWTSVSSCEKKLAGIFSICRPRKSFTCDSMITTAMPLVKPMTMEMGTKRMICPSRSAPIRKRMAPAIIVASSRLDMPYCRAMP